MFHTTHIHVPRNRRPSALRTFITSSSFGPADTKEPLRRGILLTAVAIVLLLIGSILTWLGFNDVFGGRMSMTGPLLIALSLLLLLLSFRQFLLARKRNSNSRSSMQLDAVAEGTVTAVVVNHDDGLHPSTIIVDRYNRITYDNSVTVHRHSVEDCAPPSYHEVTQLSSSSNTPSCATHDGQDELPPTYEESVSAGMFSSHGHHVSSAHPHHHDRGAHVSSHCAYSPRQDAAEAASSQVQGRFETDIANARRHIHASDGMYHCAHKSSPQQTRALPCLQLDTSFGAHMYHSSQNVGGGGHSVSTPSQHPRHSLTPPPLHMSAPSSPRQLSAPPSPHPFSAPSSPRPLGPHPSMTPPPQYMSLVPSPYQLSAPPSPHAFSAPPSPNPFSAMPHNFAVPSSPGLMQCRQSLTPPPQYTSAPPSPRQLSAPPSPHMFTGPPLPCSLPAHRHLVHPIPQLASASSSPYPHPNPHQLAAPPSHLQFSAAPTHPQSPSIQQPHSWAVSPKASSAQEGYTCFTYNFVTPLPVETSPTTHTLRTHAATVNFIPGGGNPPNSQNTRFVEVGQGQGQGQRHHQMPPVASHGTSYGAAPQYSSVPHGESGGATQARKVLGGRTDIQANI
ncbi:hypothetical protein BaRGS_00027570 [Batillaria attramentaria]|uniref:Uncharacterized protein n=1 Tax=Batillaria attramentaria TaxID=370345 RepID=A0ABD0K240_9CAEN